jgi:hypothetical protein
MSSSRKNRTYNRRSHTVSTVKKSHATMPAACWRRNAARSWLSAVAPVEQMAAQRRADRGCRDAHAKPLELALDAL